jgi:hypothetical protein
MRAALLFSVASTTLAAALLFCTKAASAAPPAGSPSAQPEPSRPPPAPAPAPALAASAAASASNAGPPSLPDDVAPPWEVWPTGRLFGPEVARPAAAGMKLRVCSFERPVCVHAPTEADGPRALEALALAEGAMASLDRQARLPPPFPDGDSGGSPALDIYLTALEGGASYRVGLETPTHFPVDRSAAFGLVERRLGPGCGRATAIHRVVATAMLAAIDGGAAGGTFASSAAYLAMMTSGCDLQVLDAVDHAQAHPELPSIPTVSPDDPLASPLLPWYLDGAFSGGAPGSLLTALWYAGQQRTPLASSRIRNDPDFFLVVARAARGQKKSLDDVLIDFSVSRAFVGDRDDGQHFPEAARLGSFGRPRFDASWPYRSLPRRIAYTPLEPTGAVLLWVDLAGAPEHTALNFHAAWEYPVTMHWALVRVSPDGQEISRIDVTHERGVYTSDQQVLELDGAAGLLIVGASSGEVALDHPFQIDEAPYEPHGGTVYVYAEPPQPRAASSR